MPLFPTKSGKKKDKVDLTSTADTPKSPPAKDIRLDLPKSPTVSPSAGRISPAQTPRDDGFSKVLPPIPISSKSSASSEVSMDAALLASVKPFMDVADQLHDVRLGEILSLPKIVVVGDQSTGKSSVLEGLLGKDFLPTGPTLVTRVPSYVRMINDRSLKPDEWQAYIGLDRQALEPVKMSNLCSAIKSKQVQAVGDRMAIENKPIYIDVRSPSCPNLTLVDLPGIARNSMGDQPQNIEDLTKALVAEYIRSPETIILAIVPANADPATWAAIQLARKFDPELQRTVGVITKVDQMNRGESVKDVLENKVPNLKLSLGWVVVKNRSHQQKEQGLTVMQGRKAEEQWFAEHSPYCEMSGSYLGLRALQLKLMTVLADRIAAALPELERKVSDHLADVERELAALGPDQPDTPEEHSARVTQLLMEYSQGISNMLTSRYEGTLKARVKEGGVFGFAKILQVFKDMTPTIEAAVAKADPSDAEILAAINNCSETNIQGFLPYRAFETLALLQISKLSVPALRLLDDVHRCLQDSCSEIAQENLSRYPNLLNVAKQAAFRRLDSLRDDTRSKITDIIERQNYIFSNSSLVASSRSITVTKDKDKDKTPADPVTPLIAKLKGAGKGEHMGLYLQLLSTCLQNHIPMSYLYDNLRAAAAGEPEMLNSESARIKETRRLLHAYLVAVKDTVSDEVPKAIGYSYLSTLQRKLHADMLQLIQQSASYDPVALLEEKPEVRDVRQRLINRRRILQKSLNILQNTH